jgi:hypothetical protein
MTANQVKTKGGSVTWRSERLPDGSHRRVVVIRKRKGKVRIPADPKPAGTPKGTGE